MGGTPERDQLRAGQTTFMVRWATFAEEMPEMAAAGGEQVFELLLERALWAKYGPRPSWPPVYTRWHGILEAPDGDH